MKKSKKLKAVVLSMGLGVAMLTTTSVQAQVINLLDEYYDELDQKNSQNDGPLLRETGTVSGEGLTVLTQGFGEAAPSPLGSGIAILIGAGLGYVALKKKEDEQ